MSTTPPPLSATKTRAKSSTRMSFQLTIFFALCLWGFLATQTNRSLSLGSQQESSGQRALMGASPHEGTTSRNRDEILGEIRKSIQGELQDFKGEFKRLIAERTPTATTDCQLQQPQPLQKRVTARNPTPSLRYDSRNATVLAMAQGYDLLVHKRFVGSLRKSGFQGTIILATEQNLKKGVERFLKSMNVTLAPISYVPCDIPIYNESLISTAREREGNTCVAPYSDVKIRWGRYPFLRDALLACKRCTGPVLMTDARDTIFQRDPFGDGVPEIEEFHFFAEHVRRIDATHPFIAGRMKKCRDFRANEGDPMLCSGTTIGTRDSMMLFIQVMYEEMKYMMGEPKCLLKSHGGDQAIMNYLYYSGTFEKAGLKSAIFQPRHGIVNTVGVIGKLIDLAHYEDGYAKGWKGPASHAHTFATNDSWLGPHFDLTDDAGFFIDDDGSRSRVIHQYDRFSNVLKWIDSGTLYDKN